MHRGYVKLWRKSIDSGLIRNHKVWIFWTWCLLKANHSQQEKQVVGYQEVFLKPGQFVFGRKVASIETGLTQQNIRTCLNFLKKSQNLTIKPTNKFSIITITNWDTYQKQETKNNQQANKQVTSNQPASNQQVTTNKNDKNDKNDKKTPLPPKGKLDVLKDYLLKNIPEEMETSVLKIIEFYKYRQQKPKAKRYDTEKKINGLLRDLSNCKAAGYDIESCLEIAMERGWMTPSVDYFKPEMFIGMKSNRTEADILKEAGFTV